MISKQTKSAPTYTTAIFLFFVILIFVPSVWAKSSLDAYAEGRRLMQRGQFLQALDLIRGAQKHLNNLQDYLIFDEASCLEKMGDIEGAMGRYREIIRLHQSSLLYRPAFRRQIELARIWHQELALQEFRLYLKQFPGDARVLLDFARFLEETGARTEALETYRELFFSGSTLVLESAKILKKSSRPPAQSELTQAALRLFQNDLYDEAISLFEIYLPADDEARLTYARALFNRRRYQEAIKILEALPLRAGRILLASSLARANERTRFYRLVEELAKNGVGDIYALQFSMAELKRREGNTEEAKKIFTSMQAAYPERWAEITWSLIWLEIRRRNFSRAEEMLLDLVSRKDGRQDKYYFWLGKVRSYQGKDGSQAFAELKDDNGYYFLKFNKGYRLRNPPLDAAKNATTQPLPEHLQIIYNRISDLIYLAMANEAAQEAQRALPLITTPELTETFAELLLAADDFHTVIRLGIRNNILKYRYPIAFFPLVQNHAEKSGIDPMLVISLMREESHFRVAAVSRAGALGLMQLMPTTAKRFTKLGKKEELFDPDKNIAVGTQYLAKLLEEFASFHLALAAYNAGEGRVRNWLNSSSYLCEDEFIEDIPFSETRGYVMKVLRTYEIKKLLWAK